MNKRTRFAAVVAVLALAVMGSAIPMSAQQVRLSARKNKVINGIEAELRGDYRERANIPVRLNSELENINIPIGKKVAFCLLQNGGAKLIGVGHVTMVGGIPVASFELSANDGDTVPNINARDVLQARQTAKAPFRANPRLWRSHTGFGGVSKIMGCGESGSSPRFLQVFGKPANHSRPTLPAC